MVDDFDLFDREKSHKFECLHIKGIGLSDTKTHLGFDLACETDDKDTFERDTQCKSKRGLYTDAKDLPEKKSKPTEPTKRLNGPTIGGTNMDVNNIDDALNDVDVNMLEEHSFHDILTERFLENHSIIQEKE